MWSSRWLAHGDVWENRVEGFCGLLGRKSQTKERKETSVITVYCSLALYLFIRYTEVINHTVACVSCLMQCNPYAVPAVHRAAPGVCVGLIKYKVRLKGKQKG